MIILRIVEVLSLTHQRHQEISVDAFVMMKRNERQIEEPQEGADEQNRRR